MAATERTYLTRPNDPPHYIEFAGIIRNRRNRIRQFQCCVCAFLLTLFVISVVMTISYSISHTSTNNLTAATNSKINPEINLLKSAEWKLNPDPPDDDDDNNLSPLTDGETIQGIQAGNEAIEKRRISDAYTKPLPSPSPNFRHQFAVSTSLEAGALALAGVGEIAATKRIEESRSLNGKSSSFGSYFNGGWTSHGTCKKFKEINCEPSKYRTYDGTCNNKKQWGAAMRPYRRILPPAYANKIDSPRRAISGKSLPTAREVSLKIHPPSPSSNPAFTVMLAVYGQFLDHDITATAISQGINGSSLSCCSTSLRHPECFPVKVGHGDPVYDIGKSSCMEFVRSAPASQCKIGPRQQLNQVTSFIDGSTIYGSDEETISNLREFNGGHLKMQVTSDNRTLLPRSTNFNDGCNRKQEWKRGRYCFAAGDKRANENLHLTTMHILWARQHNLLADKLHALNPSWNDETLFQESRRILGAQLQHITYNEFLPIVLGETLINAKNLKPLKSGYRRHNQTVNPTLANNFASAAFRFAHTLLPGLMKLTNAEKGTISYIELHRMLFNPYSLYGEEGITKSVTMATSNVIQKTSTHVTSQLTSHLFEDPASNKTLPCGLDLVSLNIQRGRDHGLPGYIQWREHCGLKKPSEFSDLKDDLDPAALNAISKLYKSVDDVDLYTGALAEIPQSDGIVGPTFTCLIGEQFERSQQGDSFWYENSDHPGAFTEEQLRELRKMSLAKLICDCSDGITEIQAEVMKSEDVNNPIISCEDISEPSLEAWREIPHLSAEEPAGDENWLNFKTDINKTVQNFVDSIKGNEPSIPDDDYIQFQKELNESFQNLRNELQDLRPDSFDFDHHSLTSDIEPIDSPESSPTDSDLISVMMFMNSSLQDATNQVSLVARKHPVHHDWEDFKSNIKRVLNCSVDQLKEGSSSRDDWLAFKDKIKIEVMRIKTEVADMKNQIADIKKNPKLQKLMDEDSDWQILKHDVVKSIGEVVNVIEDSLPPSGDPNRRTFVQFIKNQFHRFRNRVTDDTENSENTEDNENTEDIEDTENIEDAKNTENTEDDENTENTLNADITEDTNHSNDQFSFSHWQNAKRRAVKSLNEAIRNIETNKPDWSKYRDEIRTKFSKKRKHSSWKFPNESHEWVKFKRELYEIFERIIEDIRDKAPKSDDPSWPEYEKKIIDMLSKFRSDIPVRPPVLLTIADGTVFDWKTFKSDMNKSLCKLMDDKKSGNLSSNDSRWKEFREKFHKSINDSKYRMSVLKLNFAENSKSDWINFRRDLKEAIENVVQYIKKNAPPCGSSDWIEFGKEIRKKFADIRHEFDLRKAEILGRIPELKKINQREFNSDDWNSLKGDINKTVNASMSRRKWRKYWICDSKWMKFCNYVNKSISEFKNNVSELSSKVHEKQLLKLSTDWSDFSNKINNSLTNALKNVENNKISKNLDWMNLRESIRNNVAQLKEEIAKIKEEWLLMTDDENKIQNITDLEETTDQSFSDLKNQVQNLEIESIRFNITEEDWNEFKKSINKTVNNYINSIKQNNSNEWMNFKDLIKNSMDDLKKQIASLKNYINESIEQISIKKNSLQTITNISSIQKNNNKTIDGILNNLNNSSITNSNLNKVKEALVRARDQILGLSYNDSESIENISKWKKYQDSVKDHFNELNNAMKNKTNPTNNVKSSASKLTIFYISTSTILIQILVRLEIMF